MAMSASSGKKVLVFAPSSAAAEVLRQQGFAASDTARDAIQELSRGKTEKGFDKLDQFGTIQEIEDEATRLAAIAKKQIEAIREKKTSLIVAPTHGECRQIAKAVRQAMRNEGLLLSPEHTISRLEKLNLTTSQRQDSINYELGNVVEIHRRAAGGFKSGEQWQVVGRPSSSEVIIEIAVDARKKIDRLRFFSKQTRCTSSVPPQKNQR
jgi:hypothetical protein